MKNFTLVSNQYGFEMFLADPEIYEGIVTNDVSEALVFDNSKDNPTDKINYYKAYTDHNWEIKNIN